MDDSLLIQELLLQPKTDKVKETHNGNVVAELDFPHCRWILMLQTNNIKEQIHFFKYSVSMWYNHWKVGWQPSEVAQASLPCEAGLRAVSDQVSHGIWFLWM